MASLMQGVFPRDRLPFINIYPSGLIANTDITHVEDMLYPICSTVKEEALVSMEEHTPYGQGANGLGGMFRSLFRSATPFL